jgi:orotate phosphoribosyltransferase
MDRTSLLELLAEQSFKQGDFILSSGVHSPYYVDARLTTMSPAGLRLIGELGFQALREQGWHPDAIGGLTLGADPIAYAIAYFSADTDTPIRAFSVRKEPKAHGAARQIEGPFRPTDSCVVVEDVITTGASAISAISVLRKAGAKILGVLAIVDREESGSSRIRELGIPLVSLTRVSELAEVHH